MRDELRDWWQTQREHGAPLPYLLIDCAGVEGGQARLPRQLFSVLECLFTGDLADELADVSGYLGRLLSWDEPVASAAMDLLRRQLACMLVLPEASEAGASADPGFAVLHRHLRKYNVVYRHDGQPLFWRYYDPRPLPETLDNLEPAQRQNFMQHLDSIVCSDPQGQLTVLRAQA